MMKQAPELVLFCHKHLHHDHTRSSLLGFWAQYQSSACLHAVPCQQLRQSTACSGTLPAQMQCEHQVMQGIAHS